MTQPTESEARKLRAAIYGLLVVLLLAGAAAPPPKPSLAEQIEGLGRTYERVIKELESQREAQAGRYQEQQLNMGRYIINLMRACGTNQTIEIERAGIGTNWSLIWSINATNTNRVVIRYSLTNRHDY